MQTVIITKLSELLDSAMYHAETDEEGWYKDSQELLQDLEDLKMFHDSRRWSGSNFKNQMQPEGKGLNLPALPAPKPPSDEGSHIVGLPSLQFNDSLNQKANKEEEEFGESWDEESLSRYFKEKKPKKVREEKKTLKNMSIAEIEAWERAQDNATDIYKIKARMMNLARDGGASITPVGEILINSFVHMLKSFYDFADKIEDSSVKIQLTDLIRAQEGVPSGIIKASTSGVRIEKEVKK
jgi:hypothetical protein